MFLSFIIFNYSTPRKVSSLKLNEIPSSCCDTLCYRTSFLSFRVHLSQLLLMSSLQVLQNKAAKIILDRLLYSSASHALATLKWIPLEKRRFQRRCVHVYKCLNELITHELTLETQQHQHNYNTRNKVNLRLPCVKRKWGKQRTAYHAVNDFNSLSEMIRDCSNVNIFNRRVYRFLI